MQILYETDEAKCGTCNFNNNEWCGWTNAGEGQQQWSLVPASKFLLQTNDLPKVDGANLANGSYLIIDTSHGSTYNLPAVLSSPVLGPTGPNCYIKFRFHQPFQVTDNSSLFLRVYIHRDSGGIWFKQIADIKGTTTDWMTVTAQIGALSAGYDIQIQALGVRTAGTVPYADLAIDEISFENCSATADIKEGLNCSFETDMCGWYACVVDVFDCNYL